MIKKIKGLIKYTTQSFPKNEKERIEHAKVEAYNEAINDVLDAVKTNQLKSGYVKIISSEGSFEKSCKEIQLKEVAKKLRRDNSGEEGFYAFLKFLWVQFPDNREDARLDEVVPYK